MALILQAYFELTLYKNNYENGKTIPQLKDLVENKRVSPKKGRVVVFDGYFWHTACQPENNKRLVINYNVI